MIDYELLPYRRFGEVKYDYFGGIRIEGFPVAARRNAGAAADNYRRGILGQVMKGARSSLRMLNAVTGTNDDFLKFETAGYK